MADDKDESSSDNSKVRALPPCSTTKFRAGADAELIELVRTRPVLYNPSHSQFMNKPLKNAIWVKIGKQLRASPSACKTRWNNIRDNYRKALRRRIINGRLQYKFASEMGFMDPFYKGQVDPLGVKEPTIKRENLEESVEETTKETAPQTSEASSEADENEDALSNQSESAVDQDMLEASANVSGSFPHVSDSIKPSSSAVSQGFSPSHSVDAFLGAIGPSLKGLNPYHLSLAKAEIFATVHKYELKGIMETGWVPPDVNPLP